MQILQQAEAYRARVVAQATGEASRFTSVYEAYTPAKDITRKRMYLEMMEEVLGDVDKIIIDNATCAITKACYYEPKMQRSYEDFAQEYGFMVSACPPYDPQKKGRVESGVKYVKNKPIFYFLQLK